MKRIYALSFSILLPFTVLAQSWETICTSSEYIYGTGSGSTVAEADRHALANLVGMISTFVSSNTSMGFKELNVNGSIDHKGFVESRIKTYSQATLTNTERIILKNEPDAVVGRYIKKAELDRIFEGRKSKVMDMVESAERAEKKGKIDDALRYYYWSLCLLKSLQYPDEVKYSCPDGKQRLLSTWIPEKMNDIFSEIKISPIKQVDNEIVLSVKYKDKPINSFDYTYFDGMDWSNIYSAKDGQGVADLRPGQTFDNLKIKCEYEFAGESHIDKELENVMTLVGSVPFRDAYINVATKEIIPKDNVQLSTPVKEVHSNTNSQNIVQSFDKHLVVLNDIAKGISQKNYNSLKSHFTQKGWEQFQKLIHYGRATLIENSDINFNKLGDKVICRGFTMSFGFKNNNRKFVENVVFTFNNGPKIDEVLFGLGKEAYNDIMMKGVWDMDARLILTNFLEEYKTAYALKDIDFIRNVFDDNAVIITGRMTSRPRTKIENSSYIDSKIVKYNRQTKNEYLRNLQHCFAGNEFINIRFANNDVIKAGKGGETYGIQIKQDYYSSTYGDTGYLFLMVDVNNPDNPIIKVRTWQPEKDPEFGIFGLSNF